MYVGIIETNQGSIILIYSKVTSVYSIQKELLHLLSHFPSNFTQ